MDKRMVDFIRAMRASGVRISLAESQDAMYGTEIVGVASEDHFRASLKATLVKEHRDESIFDYFFPLFFGPSAPPMIDIPENLTPQEQQMLQDAMRSLAGMQDALRDLLNQLMSGKPFSDEQLEQMAQQAGLQAADDQYQRQWFERRMISASGLRMLQEMLEQMLQQLEEMGMNDDQLQELRDMINENLGAYAEQIRNYVGLTIAERMAEQDQPPKNDVMDIPLQRLGRNDVDDIRNEIRRLAAKLRSRASLRQKRAKDGSPDPRRTMRSNMKYFGTPMEIKRKKRHVKPQLVLICDVSTSMRYCVEFLLTMVYELQDQVARTDSFIFIDDLVDVSMDLKEHEPQTAVAKIMRDNPPGYYSTDLGNSLNTFKQNHMGLVTSKTTVIILGDGRNNYNDPRIDIVQDMRRKSRRLIWFNPEHEGQWGTGDSDMLMYAPHSDGVYYVRTLRDLAEAVDQVLADASS